MSLENSFELLKALKQEYKANTRDKLWWPNSGSFEVVVGTILTQQTKWENVELSLQNLKNFNALNLNSLSKIDISSLETLIKPSGFYRKKAKNLQLISQNILKEFENFQNFALHVNKKWLMKQKGLGQESCDSVLCYACKKEFFVVDSYTNRLLNSFGYEFETYDELQEWMVHGLYENQDKINILYKRKIPMNEVFARFHGKIVMYCKQHMRGKKILKKLSGLAPD